MPTAAKRGCPPHGLGCRRPGTLRLLLALYASSVPSPSLRERVWGRGPVDDVIHGDAAGPEALPAGSSSWPCRFPGNPLRDLSVSRRSLGGRQSLQSVIAWVKLLLSVASPSFRIKMDPIIHGAFLRT